MQVTQLESKGLKRQFKVTVEQAQISQQMEKELKLAGEQVKIPGFRPGFIPMKVLQQRFGKSVQGDVLKQVINQATSEVLTKEKLRPALMPQINIDDYREGGELVFTMAFENFPEVPDVDFDKITLHRHTFEIDEKTIDEAVDRVATHSPRFEKLKDGVKAEKGNLVIIDFKGSIDGELFEGGSASDFRLELGSSQFIGNFEEQLIGAKAGDERTVEVSFPKEYHAKHLAGKPASFVVTIKEIHSKQPAEINEEFAKAHGFADVRGLREAVRNQLFREYDQLVRGQLKKELFDVLEESYDFEMPQGMIDLEFNTIWERLQEAKKQGDPSVADKSEDELKEEYQQIARRRVKLGLILAEIGNRNKIQISREELSRAMMQQAQMYPGQERKIMDFYRDHPERLDELRGPILEEKAVDLILTKIKFNDHKVSLEQLSSGHADEAAESQSKPKSKKKKAAS